ncbi:hypothetical protein PQC55_gp124 [Escherichia phage vB_EcoP-CHD5UKE1]|uniref:Uncharacterized protein n=1 Tax=Escherichia phage vB_EcoP-CHD5UKE1 TaxID=2865805 RepID=A0ABX9AI97_9CAUD|nr:hypothetical protein PQC55_gp124 [Escherichia phage vB_EcoP-CHD5UKE1]QZI80634.1 hypothetical protein CHD5UKE1_138 [Escherichia phage vB_EcoP-CHD5UKE1]
MRVLDESVLSVVTFPVRECKIVFSDSLENLTPFYLVCYLMVIII